MVNKQRMEAAVGRLAKRIGFRVAPGFSERVVFRELFPRGLTLLDLKDVGVSSLSMSHVAARQELRELVRALACRGWRCVSNAAEFALRKRALPDRPLLA
jgi:chromosome partitioning protein